MMLATTMMMMKQECPQSCGKSPALLGLLGTRPNRALSLKDLHAQRACSSRNSPSCNLAAAQWEFPIVERSPLVSTGCPIFTPKITPSHGPIPNPTTCLIPGPVQPTMPNGIRIRSAVFPQSTGQTDRQTDRQSNRWLAGMFDHYSPLMPRR